MAGCGRNYSILKKYFYEIEMLDATKKMVQQHDEFVKSHHSTVQNFKWPLQRFNCIMGCWAFCYLDDKERFKLTVNITDALFDGGMYILIEPVVQENEP